ncbi:hypothetical protein GOP47_0025126 [Adiantum capillus-veneris]|uniref:Uncharacterized protein n=1 Tax=Adiantum capillus-veneris TaxID=13818 RepID=A0A9D4U5N3_ADICA|nr:hypothetical protein GOP47_0025126 [Adiantum capillus-veneris]
MSAPSRRSAFREASLGGHHQGGGHRSRRSIVREAGRMSWRRAARGDQGPSIEAKKAERSLRKQGSRARAAIKKQSGGRQQAKASLTTCREKYTPVVASLRFRSCSKDEL